ncbi:MAG: RdgB/HAM1 family non-canonical purine NTP pyrophosphatase [Xanthomonadales bacterium]|nr:RdgB/HAM1 family non-canonical purine NTP pyrophosphatase [Xanthomonadales bacterium]
MTAHNPGSQGRPTLVIASGNPGKVKEIGEILSALGWAVRAQKEWDVPEAVEDGLTFVENALIKARNAARVTGLPALGDDSGLVVDALEGRPGLRSARYAGAGGSRANIEKLLGELDGVPEEHRVAHFYCVMTVVRFADDPAPLIATGRWDGRIAESPRGEGGFGYDPVFYDPARGCTAAQLPQQEKNAISHRGRALQGIVALLSGELQA